MKFSIITPTYNRAHMLPRALNSVAAQTFTDFEHIIVDDCSDDGTKDLVTGIYADIKYPQVRYIKTPFHGDRVRARNLGMKEAEGEWICWLDSDDMYVPYYLEILSMAISKAPKAKLFNFGGINVHRSYASTLRSVTEFKKGEVFRAGNIPSGHFIFKKELLKKTGYLPETNDCWAFAEEFKKRFPEVRPLYKEKTAELGNPWGDDFALFYMLTRIAHPKPLNLYLYIIWGREEKILEILK